MADGNDLDMEHKIRNFLTALQVWSGSDKGQVENIDRGIRRLVEARSRATGREQTAEQKQGKQVRFAGEEQPGEKRAQSTHEQDVMDGLEEVRTGRGSAGLARRERTGVTRTRPAERAKAKGNGGKGEHGSKGETGSKGMHQVTNMMKGDDDEKEKVNQRGDDECRETKFEWELRRLEEKRRALEEHEQRHEEEEKCENEDEDERVRVASNVGAGGSHPQALSDSEEGERVTLRVRWADCKAEEGKEEEEQETAVEREEDTEGEKETGQVKMASEKPPGLEQEGREWGVRAQEERERQAREAKAKEERREEEREVEAQGRHEEGAEKTMQQDCVEGKEVEPNSMHDENDVSNRHRTWWRNAWWIRVVNGPHLRTAPSLCSKPGGFPHVIFSCPVSFSPFASSSLSTAGRLQAIAVSAEKIC